MYSRARMFAADLASVTQARRFTRETLQTWQALAWHWPASTGTPPGPNDGAALTPSASY